uniref:Uncharacterized protein n=1 Tax=Oryza meridionalis TaxID=40149 RepID=A0A0E0EKC0_9ORYZ
MNSLSRHRLCASSGLPLPAAPSVRRSSIISGVSSLSSAAAVAVVARLAVVPELALSSSSAAAVNELRPEWMTTATGGRAAGCCTNRRWRVQVEPATRAWWLHLEAATAAELEDSASGDWRPSLGAARAATATTVLGGRQAATAMAVLGEGTSSYGWLCGEPVKSNRSWKRRWGWEKSKVNLVLDSILANIVF